MPIVMKWKVLDETTTKATVSYSAHEIKVSFCLKTDFRPKILMYLTPQNLSESVIDRSKNVHIKHQVQEKSSKCTEQKQL